MTDKVAQKYQEGDRLFKADEKDLGVKCDGYEKPYAFSTLSITYQQYCKYTTLVVPRPKLKKYAKKYDDYQKDYKPYDQYDYQEPYKKYDEYEKPYGQDDYYNEPYKQDYEYGQSSYDYPEP